MCGGRLGGQGLVGLGSEALWSITSLSSLVFLLTLLVGLPISIPSRDWESPAWKRLTGRKNVVFVPFELHALGLSKSWPFPLQDRGAHRHRMKMGVGRGLGGKGRGNE